jgi:hypothetical protein
MDPLADPIRDLRRTLRELDKLPPRPRAFYTSHSVPYGRAYRQWTSRGELIVWISRGEFEDMPRRKAVEIARMFEVPSQMVLPLSITGIAVYHT